MQAERDARISKSFLEIALQLTQDLDLDSVLETVVERAMELTGAPFGSAVTVGPAGDFERFLHRGLTAAEVAQLPHLPEGKGLLGAVLQERVTIRCDHIDQHPDSIGFPSEHVQMDAFLGTPIAHKGLLLGAIYLTKPPSEPAFHPDDESVIEAMAALAGVGVNNARSLERVRQRSELNLKLRKISAAVKDTLDLSEVLATTVEELGLAAGVDRCNIRMVEAPGANDLGPIEYEWNAEGMAPLASDPEVQYPIASMAALTRMTQWSDDVPNDTRLTDPDIPGNSLDIEHMEAKAVLSTPLEWGDELLGVVTFHSQQTRRWGDEDVTLIELAAREVSSAVHHARLYEEALESVQEMQALEERRGEYISMVSHEIRSPMTVVAGIADILQKKRHRLPDEAIADLVESLGREARRLARLVSEILDLERIDRGGMTLVTEPLDAVKLAEEAVEDTGEASRIVIDTEPDAILLEADRDKLKQVFINLISNATKFSPDGTPVTVSIKRDDGYVLVAVRDEGPGIAPDEIEHLFQRFSRLQSTVLKPGSGLGLYLSRLIVERHKGRIWVESELGRGTTFMFRLPLAG